MLLIFIEYCFGGLISMLFGTSKAGTLHEAQMQL
jgi:hypothetical protein